MKACIISLSILTALLCLSVINALYIDKVCSDLLSLEKSFPDKEDGESSPDRSINRAEELWKSSYVIVTLTCHTESPNTVTLALEHLKSCYLHGSRADYLSARSAFINAVRALDQSEKLSFLNII